MKEPSRLAQEIAHAVLTAEYDMLLLTADDQRQAIAQVIDTVLGAQDAPTAANAKATATPANGK